MIAEPALVILDDCAKTLGAGASTSSICQCHHGPLLTNNSTLSLAYAAPSGSSRTHPHSRTPPEHPADVSHPVDRHDQEGSGCVQEERVH